MPTTYATPQDVDSRWFGQPSFMEPLDANLRDGVQQLLDDAHILLRKKIPDIDARVLAGTTDYELVTLVLCGAVLRVMNNPRGFQRERTGQVEYDFGAGREQVPRVSFTPEELALLGATAATTGAFVQTVRRNQPEWQVAWGSSTSWTLRR